jgi:hypothetical protein
MIVFSLGYKNPEVHSSSSPKLDLLFLLLKQTNCYLSGFPISIQEINDQGKNVISSLCHPQIKVGSCRNTLRKLK